MHNQPCYNKEGNMIGWLSRSIAVTNIVFSLKDDVLYVLASKRGTGTPDPEFIGKWNLCCGYLDYDETLEEAAIRETFEETGVPVKLEEMHLWCVNSDPESDKRQNVGIRFISLVEDLFPTSSENSEPDEVSDIKWINIEDITKYDWAFNHKNLIDGALYEIFAQLSTNN